MEARIRAGHRIAEAGMKTARLRMPSGGVERNRFQSYQRAPLCLGVMRNLRMCGLFRAYCQLPRCRKLTLGLTYFDCGMMLIISYSAGCLAGFKYKAWPARDESAKTTLPSEIRTVGAPSLADPADPGYSRVG
jgi:hypothetical protein